MQHEGVPSRSRQAGWGLVGKWSEEAALQFHTLSSFSVVRLTSGLFFTWKN
jgi:hypothetical protein